MINDAHLVSVFLLFQGHNLYLVFFHASPLPTSSPPEDESFRILSPGEVKVISCFALLLKNNFSLDHLPLFLSFLSLLSFCLRLFPRSSFSPICGDSVATFLVKSYILHFFSAYACFLYFQILLTVVLYIKSILLRDAVKNVLADFFR